MLEQQVIGNLGKDAELKNLNGSNVINFSVAHTEKWTANDGTKKEKTVWVDCAYWTDKTGIVPYLKKGTQVYVSGQPDVRAWNDQQGDARASLTLRVMRIHLLGSKPEGQQQAAQQQPAAAAQQRQAAPQQTTTPAYDPNDDLPF